MVEIVEETNDDWWTGKCRGRQGLFPSNHVDKIEGGSGGPPPPVPSAPSPWSGAVAMPSAQVPNYPSPGYQSYGGDKAPYRPFGAAYGNDMPPPNGLQPHDEHKEQKEGKEKKGKKFGKLGGTVGPFLSWHVSKGMLTYLTTDGQRGCRWCWFRSWYVDACSLGRVRLMLTLLCAHPRCCYW